MSLYLCGRHAVGSSPRPSEKDDKLVPDHLHVPGRVFKKVASGEDFSVAIDSYGFLYSWGRQREGQCGRGVSEHPADPGRIDALAGEVIDDIEAGAQHTMAVTATGKLFHFGVAFQQEEGRSNDDGAHLFGVSSRRLGEDNRSMVMASHALYISGEDEMSLGEMAETLKRMEVEEAERKRGEEEEKRGEGREEEEEEKEGEKAEGGGDEGKQNRFVGRKLRRTRALKERAKEYEGEAAAVKMAESMMKNFRRVKLGDPTLVSMPRGTRVVSVSAGFSFTVFVTNERGVYAYGVNDKGQCGTGDRVTKDIRLPARVAGIQDKQIVEVASGEAHTIAKTANGELYSWGMNAFGQLGLPGISEARIPQQVKALKGEVIESVACGAFHSMCISSVGHVFAFGHSEYGQTGCGNLIDEGTRTVKLADSCQPQRLDTAPTHSRPVKIACGALHTILLTESGEAFTFGFGGTGTLGTGNRRFYVTPTLVEQFAGVKVKDIAAGPKHSLFVVAEANAVSADMHALAAALEVGAAKEVEEGSSKEYVYLRSVKAGGKGMRVYPLLAFARSARLKAAMAMTQKWNKQAKKEKKGGRNQVDDKCVLDLSLRTPRQLELKMIVRYLHGGSLPAEYPSAFFPLLRKASAEVGATGLVHLIGARTGALSHISPRSLSDDMLQLLRSGEMGDVRVHIGRMHKQEEGDDEGFDSTLHQAALLFLSQLVEVDEDGTGWLSLHRFVLCARSEYFRGALEGGFRELSGVLEHMSDLFPSASSLYCVLVYLYAGMLPFEKIILPWEEEEMDKAFSYPADGSTPIVCTLEEGLDVMVAGNAVLADGLVDAVAVRVADAMGRVVKRITALYMSPASSTHDDEREEGEREGDSEEETILSILTAVLIVSDTNKVKRLWQSAATALLFFRDAGVPAARKAVEDLLASQLDESQRSLLLSE